MPELPDIVVYIEHLEARLIGQRLARVRLMSPFVLRSVAPPIASAEGKKVVRVRRMGKRIVIAFEGELFLVLHLMIAGRLRWFERDAKLPGRITLAAFEFSGGTLAFTEAGTKRRASLHVVAGEAALAAMDPGGLDVLATGLQEFADRLKRENHTLKRALTDPRSFSGIGNAYSDEILQSPPFAKAWRCTDDFANPARCAARRCSASCTRRTRPTTARAARRAARSSPTAPSRACSRRAGRARSTNSIEWPTLAIAWVQG